MTVVASRTAPAKVTELQTRVENRKRELIAEIIEHKKSSRVGAAEEIDKIKTRLTELTHIITASVVDGWANLGEGAKRRLDDWVSR